MIRYVIVSAMFLTTGLLIYNLGQKQCRTEMLTARQELKENVQVEKSRIYARPNAGRSALLKLMRSEPSEPVCSCPVYPVAGPEVAVSWSRLIMPLIPTPGSGSGALTSCARN